MNQPNLQELATRIHEQNKAAGWWDIPRPRVQTAWLIVTELAEATEAERAGKYADLEAFENDSDYKFKRELFAQKAVSASVEMAFKRAFQVHIKDTFEDEIADAVIRLLDFAGSEGVEINYYPIFPFPPSTSNEFVFFTVCEMVKRYATYSYAPIMLSFAIGELIALADLRGFDLWQHVELKLKYNATRPKMHGGKKF